MANPDGTLESLLGRAGDARQAGRIAEERSLLDEAVSRFATSSVALNSRGMRALGDRDWARAIDCFEQASGLDPQQPALWLNLATAHRESGDSAGEQRALEAVLKIDQRHLLARVRLAELFQRQGQLSQAAGNWSAVVQLTEATADRTPALDALIARGRQFLATHNAAFAAALNRELAQNMPAVGASRRFDACVGTMLGRRRIYHNECAGLHFPFLPADEFFNPAQFPWFAALETQTDAIRREALELLDDAGDAIRPYVRMESGTPENKWADLDHSLAWGAAFLWEFGVRNDAVCARCPVTAAALAAVPQSHLPGKAPSAFFSVLQPGARIPAHTGVTNTRAIVHLPLVVPPGCGFRVGGETRQWVAGKAFAFDDTIEHEAWNTSGQPRIVLIFDVWNPHLTVPEQAMLRSLFAVADRGLVASST